MKFCVQLYSLRDIAQQKGAEGALAAVAAAGYDGVEFAGFYGMTAAALRELLDRYSLVALSAHIRPEEVECSLDIILALGIRYVFVPWAGADELASPQRYAALVDSMKRAKNLLEAGGIVFGYHNHAHEYAVGGNYVARIIKDTGAKVEPDVFWLTVAGRDAAAELKNLRGSAALVHIKEAAHADPAVSPQPVVGEGAVDMAGVFAEAVWQGIPWAVLEVEKFPCDEVEYMQKSLVNMKKLAADAQKIINKKTPRRPIK